MGFMGGPSLFNEATCHIRDRRVYLRYITNEFK